MEPVDTEAGKLLKKLENPAHSAFSAERIADAAKRGAATKSMRKLGDRLRDMIRETTGVQHEGSVVLDELGRFFAEAGKSDAPPDPDTDSDPEKYTYEAARRERQKTEVPNPMDGQRGGQTGGQRGERTSGQKGRHGSRSGEIGDGDTGSTGGREPVELIDVRNRIGPNTKGAARSRVLFFSPKVGGRIELSVQALGVNAPDRLLLMETNSGTVGHGVVTLDVDALERCSLVVSFAEPYDGPIELLAVRLETPEVPA